MKLHDTHLDQIAVVLGDSFEVQRVEQVIVSSIQKLIEDVKVSLTVVLVHDTRFLQQVVQDVTTHRCPLEEVTQKDEFFCFLSCYPSYQF